MSDIIAASRNSRRYHVDNTESEENKSKDDGHKSVALSERVSKSFFPIKTNLSYTPATKLVHVYGEELLKNVREDLVKGVVGEGGKLAHTKVVRIVNIGGVKGIRGSDLSCSAEIRRLD